MGFKLEPRIAKAAIACDNFANVSNPSLHDLMLCRIDLVEQESGSSEAVVLVLKSGSQVVHVICAASGFPKCWANGVFLPSIVSSAQIFAVPFLPDLQLGMESADIVKLNKKMLQYTQNAQWVLLIHFSYGDSFAVFGIGDPTSEITIGVEDWPRIVSSEEGPA